MISNFNNNREELKSSLEEFIKSVKKISKDKNWLSSYFDLLNKLLTDSIIKENLNQIITTKNLKIIIGNRTVVMPSSKDKVCFIMPLSTRNEIIKNYQAKISEDYFFDTKGEEQEALWVEFNRDIISTNDTFIFTNWINAVKTELDNGINSSFKKSQNKDCFNAIMDLSFRRQIML